MAGDAQLLEQRARPRALLGRRRGRGVSRMASTFCSAVSLRKTLASWGR